jgi:hypothetical protein
LPRATPPPLRTTIRSAAFMYLVFKNGDDERKSDDGRTTNEHAIQEFPFAGLLMGIVDRWSFVF